MCPPKHVTGNNLVLPKALPRGPCHLSLLPHHIPSCLYSPFSKCHTVMPLPAWLQQCCYDTFSWSLVTSTMWGATSQFLRYTPYLVEQHRISDTDPRTWCCDNSDNCDKYHEVRPIDSCLYYVPPILGRFPCCNSPENLDLFC